jgi:arylsulfatase A-like enzyme
VPTEASRRRFLSGEEVELSYTIDRSFEPMWSYTFGLHEYTPEELAIMAGTYDATLADLDELFRELVEWLARRGIEEDTIVILTSDHGEHLGEHHHMDHQYSLYQDLLRVPLVVRAPGRLAPGRDARPVMNFDLFPTLLELTGVEVEPQDSRAVSLLAPLDQRPRLAEYPAPLEVALARVKQAHPQWDPRPWLRSLETLVDGSMKIIRSSAGEREVFDLEHDPAEGSNLTVTRGELAAELEQRLDAALGGLRPAPDYEPPPEVDEQHNELLEHSGYAHGEDDDDEQE